MARPVVPPMYGQLAMSEDYIEAVSKPKRPVHVSWSQLSTYTECSLKYRLSYIDHFAKTPQGALIGGSAVHAAIEFAEAERLWAEEKKMAWVNQRGLSEFEAGVEKAGGPDAIRWAGRKDQDGVPNEGYVWWQHQLPVMLKRYAGIRNLDELNGLRLMPNGSEMEVGVTLPSGRPLKLYVDAFFMADEDGQFVVRDWKTGKVSRAVSKQPVIYAWAIREALGWTCSRVELAYLKTGAGEVVGHDVAHLIDSVPGWFAKADVGIEAAIFEPEPGWYCEGCQVKSGCPHGRTLG